MSTFSFYERSCLQVLLKLRSCKILKYWPKQRSRQDPTYFLMDEPFEELAATIFYSVDLLSFINCSSWARIILFSFLWKRKRRRKRLERCVVGAVVTVVAAVVVATARRTWMWKPSVEFIWKESSCEVASLSLLHLPLSHSFSSNARTDSLSLSAGEEESPRASGCA